MPNGTSAVCHLTTNITTDKFQKCKTCALFKKVLACYIASLVFMNPPSDTRLYRLAIRTTRMVGSPTSLVLHSIFFVGIFGLGLFGVEFSKILLILTTLVSLEAIYLAIFIQISVNMQSQRLRHVRQDVEEIQRDVEEIQEDVAGIEKDVDEIQEDVEEIQEDVEEMSEEDSATPPHISISQVEHSLEVLLKEVRELKSQEKR